jgi:hypothetical protein
LIGGSLICFYKRGVALELVTKDDFGDNNHVNKYVMVSYAGFMMFGGIMLAIIGFAYLILMFFNFKHIKTAIGVIDAAAEFIIGNKRVILVPFTYFFLTIGSFLLWAYCLILIISINKIDSS